MQNTAGKGRGMTVDLTCCEDSPKLPSHHPSSRTGFTPSLQTMKRSSPATTSDKSHLKMAANFDPDSAYAHQGNSSQTMETPALVDKQQQFQPMSQDYIKQTEKASQQYTLRQFKPSHKQFPAQPLVDDSERQWFMHPIEPHFQHGSQQHASVPAAATPETLQPQQQQYNKPVQILKRPQQSEQPTLPLFQQSQHPLQQLLQQPPQQQQHLLLLKQQQQQLQQSQPQQQHLPQYQHQQLNQPQQQQQQEPHQQQQTQQKQQQHQDQQQQHQQQPHQQQQQQPNNLKEYQPQLPEPPTQHVQQHAFRAIFIPPPNFPQNVHVPPPTMNLASLPLIDTSVPPPPIGVPLPGLPFPGVGPARVPFPPQSGIQHPSPPPSVNPAQSRQDAKPPPSTQPSPGQKSFREKRKPAAAMQSAEWDSMPLGGGYTLSGEAIQPDTFLTGKGSPLQAEQSQSKGPAKHRGEGTIQGHKQWNSKDKTKGRCITSKVSQGVGMVPFNKPGQAHTAPNPARQTQEPAATLSMEQEKNEYEWQSFKIVRKVRKILGSLKEESDAMKMASEITDVMQSESARLACFPWPKEQFVALDEIVGWVMDRPEALDTVCKLIQELHGRHPEHFQEDLTNTVMKRHSLYIKVSSATNKEKLYSTYSSLMARLFMLSRTSGNAFQEMMDQMMDLLIDKWITCDAQGSVQDPEELTRVYAFCLRTLFVIIGPHLDDQTDQKYNMLLRDQVLGNQPRFIKEAMLDLLLLRAAGWKGLPEFKTESPSESKTESPSESKTESPSESKTESPSESKTESPSESKRGSLSVVADDTPAADRTQNPDATQKMPEDNQASVKDQGDPETTGLGGGSSSADPASPPAESQLLPKDSERPSPSRNGPGPAQDNPLAGLAVVNTGHDSRPSQPSPGLTENDGSEPQPAKDSSSSVELKIPAPSSASLTAIRMQCASLYPSASACSLSRQSPGTLFRAAATCTCDGQVAASPGQPDLADLNTSGCAEGCSNPESQLQLSVSNHGGSGQADYSGDPYNATEGQDDS